MLRKLECLPIKKLQLGNRQTELRKKEMEGHDRHVLYMYGDMYL